MPSLDKDGQSHGTTQRVGNALPRVNKVSNLTRSKLPNDQSIPKPPNSGHVSVLSKSNLTAHQSSLLPYTYRIPIPDIEDYSRRTHGETNEGQPSVYINSPTTRQGKDDLRGRSPGSQGSNPHNERMGRPATSMGLQAILSTLLSSLSEGETTSDIQGTSVSSPEKFSGHDRTKFRTFIAQNRLVFRANPRKFSTDANKVTYACSYLEGTAFLWYENYVSKNLEPAWFGNFELFEKELASQFGMVNSTSIAERKINRTFMKTTEHISDYLTKFNSLRYDLDWNDPALSFAFKRGLPTRIKEELARTTLKPRSLKELVEHSTRIDFQYWDRETEKNSETTTGYHPRSQRQLGTRKAIDNSSTNLSLTPKLLFDDTGLITGKERQRRIDMKLCLYCAGDHFLDKCKKHPPHTPRTPAVSTKINLALPTQSGQFHSRNRNLTSQKGPNIWGLRGSKTFVRVAESPRYRQFDPNAEPWEFVERNMVTAEVAFRGSDDTFTAIIDSGSYHSHLDAALAYTLGLDIKPLDTPVSVIGFNGQPAGSSLHTYPWNFFINDYQFDNPESNWLISKIFGKHKIILGYDFLRTYNPIINWESTEIRFRSEGDFESQLQKKINTHTLRPPPTNYVEDTLSNEDSEEESSDGVCTQIHVQTNIPSIYKNYDNVFTKDDVPNYPATLRPPRNRQGLDYTFDFRDTLGCDEVNDKSAKTRDNITDKGTCFMMDYFNTLEARGLISPITSQQTYARAFTSENDEGKIKVYIDYTPTNRRLRKLLNTTPKIKEVARSAKEGSIFTKISFRDAFHQLRINADEEHYTRFTTPYGASFEWMVMPYGLANNVVFWQRFLENILPKAEFPFTTIHIDELLIFSNDAWTHRDHVTKVLKVLQQEELKANEWTSEFHVMETTIHGTKIHSKHAQKT